MTMEILLGWLDAEEKPGVKDFVLLVNDENFVKNLKTVYRESEDQFPGVDCTRQFRKRRYRCARDLAVMMYGSQPCHPDSNSGVRTQIQNRGSS